MTDSSALTPDDAGLAAVKTTARKVLSGSDTQQAREALTRLDPDDPTTLLAVLAHLPAPVRFRADRPNDGGRGGDNAL